MADFGDTAVRAVELYGSEGHLSPRTAWGQAAAETQRTRSMREKPCPLSTFLGLCNEGIVKGIPPGRYITAPKNRDHAIQAVRLLSLDPTLARLSPRQLWKLVAGEKTYNGQTEVVLGLWRRELIQLDIPAAAGAVSARTASGQ